MLDLRNIHKVYETSSMKVKALRGIDLAFDSKGFVSVLGPSGCGKTTLLNIIGGLDQYTEGDLKIEGLSTKGFSDQDWDTYRNHQIGFVFQNYNLITHISVLKNVEMALTLSGITPKERKKRAIKALEDVGLSDQLTKKPNQLSGGQMQRVAIARAIVNNPNIVLADEPTGSLDTETSTTIMAILKAISKDKLVIMVTHNPILAETYSDRMIHLLDGKVQSDSVPYVQEVVKVEKRSTKHTAMSHLTALNLSFNNLISKFIRTIITAIAGSIGIIGVALVLALSNGVKSYVGDAEQELLAGLPITVERISYSIPMEIPRETQLGLYPDDRIIKPYVQSVPLVQQHANIITPEYIDYIETNIPNTLYDDVTYSYMVQPIFLRENIAGNIVRVSTGAFSLQQLSANDKGFVESRYDRLEGRFLEPGELNLVLIINNRNQIPRSIFDQLGIIGDDIEISFEDIMKVEFMLTNNDTFYNKNESTGRYTTRASYAYNHESAIPVKIVGIFRVKKDVTNGGLGIGFGYSQDLTKHVLSTSVDSQIVRDQEAALLETPIINVINGNEMSTATATTQLAQLGGRQAPIKISIQANSFESKKEIAGILRAYNDDIEDTDKHIIHTDFAETVTDIMNQMINTITIVLVAFAGISLFVSSIMIGIITYVSVVERTKEIGVLRSIGARKKDISRVFNAETIIIGLAAGILGVVVTYALIPFVNNILYYYTEAKNVADLNILHALILIVISVALTLTAGFIPSRIAANKDPVVALRTE